MTAPVAVRYTADDLLEMEDAVAYELDNGELVEREVSEESEYTTFLVTHALGNYIVPRQLGYVFGPGNGMQILSDGNRVPRADVTFVPKEAGLLTRKGHSHKVPAILVEVVSPCDKASYLDRKIREYLSAGVQLIWVVYPETRTVHVFTAAGSVAILGENETLTGGEILPEFSVLVADLLPPRSAIVVDQI